MNKHKIKEVIVVEGKHDQEKLLKCIDADIIVSSGTHMSQEFLALCKTFHKTRGLIIFTDPDGPGEMIRRRIIETVGSTKHASLHILQSKKGQKVGIEHADCTDIIEALKAAATFDVQASSLDWSAFVAMKLAGSHDSRMRRDKLSEYFRFPRSNAKTTFKYLNMMHISKEAIEKVLKESQV